jgi:hypothetical protein
MAAAFPLAAAAASTGVGSSCTATGTGGQNAVLTALGDFLYTDVAINGTGISHSNSIFTLDPGTYFVLSCERHTSFAAATAFMRWSIVNSSTNTTMPGTAAGQTVSVSSISQTAGNETAAGVINLTTATSIKVRCSQTNGAYREPISALFMIVKLT